MYWAIICESGGTYLIYVNCFCEHQNVCSILIYSLLPHQEDFFFILHNILADMEEVTELQPVPDAHVPVMKFKFDGISIDLLYASISLLVVPEVSISEKGYSFLFACVLTICA